ncbi:MAG: hypothetical protein L6R36_007314 [Xanthoria steineri]|nr:MAG: hypothetical protein L6R36_007314 [Xanthoria steineri]
MEQPVIAPEDYPIPDIAPQLKPYDPRSYRYSLITLQMCASDHRHRAQFPEICSCGPPHAGCHTCIMLRLHIMADTLGVLLSTAPSLDPPTEWSDLTILEDLAKQFFNVDGNMGHWVQILIDRKCQSLAGTRLAKQMSIKSWREGDRKFSYGPMGYTYLARVKKKNATARGILQKVTKERGIVPQKFADHLIADILRAGIPVSEVVAALEDTYDVDVQVLPDSEDAEGQEDVGCGKSLGSNDLGVVSMEDVDAAPAATPMEDIITDDEADEEAQAQPDEVQHNPRDNKYSAPSSPGPVTDTKENAPREAVSSPTPNTHTPPSEPLDQTPDHDNTPRTPEPTTADEEETPVEDAFFTPQRTTGLQFDIVEREPGEVRAPAPPQQRRAAPRFH